MPVQVLFNFRRKSAVLAAIAINQDDGEGMRIVRQQCVDPAEQIAVLARQSGVVSGQGLFRSLHDHGENRNRQFTQLLEHCFDQFPLFGYAPERPGVEQLLRFQFLFVSPFSPQQVALDAVIFALTARGSRCAKETDASTGRLAGSCGCGWPLSSMKVSIAHLVADCRKGGSVSF